MLVLFKNLVEIKIKIESRLHYIAKYENYCIVGTIYKISIIVSFENDSKDAATINIKNILNIQIL